MNSLAAAGGNGRSDRVAVASRLTVTGWTALGASFVCTAAPLWQKPPVALGLGLALMLALLATAWLLPRQLRRPRATWLLPRSVHAGEETTIGARLQAAAETAPFTVSCWDPTRGQYRWLVDLPTIGPAPTRVAWVQRFPRRGRVVLPPLTMHSEYPFGLVTGCTEAGMEGELLVYPALGRIQGDLEQQLLRWVSDGSRSRERGDDEPNHLRSYRPGDPPRAVHWRASARARQLLVTVRQAPVARRLAILIDAFSNAAHSTRVERLLIVAATIVDHLLARGWQVSLHGIACGEGGTSGERDALMTRLALTEAVATEPERIAELIPRDLPCLALTTDRNRFGGDRRLLVLGPEDWDQAVSGQGVAPAEGGAKGTSGRLEPAVGAKR